jgi:hypothetical protein
MYSGFSSIDLDVLALAEINFDSVEKMSKPVCYCSILQNGSVHLIVDAVLVKVRLSKIESVSVLIGPF